MPDSTDGDPEAPGQLEGQPGSDAESGFLAPLAQSVLAPQQSSQAGIPRTLKKKEQTGPNQSPARVGKNPTGQAESQDRNSRQNYPDNTSGEIGSNDQEDGDDDARSSRSGGSRMFVDQDPEIKIEDESNADRHKRGQTEREESDEEGESPDEDERMSEDGGDEDDDYD